MDRRQQTAAAAERYRQMARDRKELKRRQKAEGSQVVDTPERVRARAARLAQAGQLQPEALVAAISPGEPLEPHVLLERIIAATNDLQAVNFLTRGARAAGRWRGSPMTGGGGWCRRGPGRWSGSGCC